VAQAEQVKEAAKLAQIKPYFDAEKIANII